MLKKIKYWLVATRAPFFTASVIPALVGAALAKREGVFSLWSLWFALVIVIFEHAGANLLNDYFDAEGSDLVNQTPTPFSGGSRCIQKGVLSKAKCLKGSTFCYSIGLSMAAFLSITHEQPFILILSMIGAALGISYSLSWTFGMGRGWGELAVGLAFGPLAVLGSYLLQTNTMAWKGFLAGVPVGFLIMGVLILNQIPDYQADRDAGKRNWTVRAGSEHQVVWIYLAIITAAYLFVLIGILSGIFPEQVLFSYSTIPLAIWIGLKSWRYQGPVAEIVPVLAGNIGLHSLTGLLIGIGLWWGS
ncbi:MAG: prenyltransferase [Bacteroidota bacterium]